MSGDAELLEVTSSGCYYNVKLSLYDGDEVVVQIMTSDMKIFDVESSSNPLIRYCHLELVYISEILSSKNGYYVPPESFGELMKETKLGLNLAYGKSLNEFKIMFFVKGHEVLLACVVKSIDQIKFELIPG
ncbi:hypothetical protein [Oceanobacter mangrovi]|uniref:hypothetical protein n=1 Tax=Oceanobacter mangrovi TaxID=2862510 RepID=UPI001C8D0FCC|nr:hypothetical protein [Oceanobacter mangrovi]